MAARSRCVAATIRTSTLIGRCQPTRSSQPSWRTRNSRTWAARVSSPSSSKRSVPPSARSNQPLRVSTAPVNAPFSCPNNCESINSWGIAPQLTRMNGPAARGERLWIARATNSLPEPVSPKMSTGTSERATSSTRSMTAWRPDSTPTIVSPSLLRPRRLRSDRLSASAASRRAAISLKRWWLPKAMENGSKRTCSQFGVARLEGPAAAARSARARPSGRREAEADRPGRRPRRRPAQPIPTRRRAARRPWIALPNLHQASSNSIWPRRSIPCGRRWRASVKATPDGHGLQAIAARVDLPHLHLGDGQMLGQQGGDGLRGLADFDMAAGLSPHVENYGSEFFHGGPPNFDYPHHR